MKRAPLTLIPVAIVLMLLTACHPTGSPYDEFEILPLEEAPAPPEAPEADAPIAAEEPDAAVSDVADPSNEPQGEVGEAVITASRVVAPRNRLKVGDMFQADIKILLSDPAEGSENECGECFFRTYLNGEEYVSERGVIHYETLCTDTGTFYLQGVAYVEKPTGTEKYPYSSKYVVE